MEDYVKAAKLIKKLIGDIGKGCRTWADKLMSLSDHCEGRCCCDCAFRQHLHDDCYSGVLVEQCDLSEPEEWNLGHEDVIELLKLLSPNKLNKEP